MAKRSARQRELDEAFWMGALSAMAVVAMHDQEVIWREIAATCGGYKKLRELSARNEQLDIDGFTAYKEPR